ncbi:50S ribosomal protein L5 [Exophiala viscosa]|uniref:50S ribosomal protein L5 n=1 Tax=Exophiala viscosa TaxID=2486360 RepID=UPI0021943A9C|nr:50S ribosomal protein L5 [Exophiala viscosa]
MASPSLPFRFARSWPSINNSSMCNRCLQARRTASTQAVAANTSDPDMEEISSLNQLGSPDSQTTRFDPVKTAKSRKRQLPPSRYQFRSPKYDRGPLHPHQPLPPSDPASREFVPGPFSTPRVEQAYHNIIAPDYMTLVYQHKPPGYKSLEKGPRLRPWVGDSPYFANRQLRGPRGGDVLRLLRKPVTFRNIPMVERVTVHAYVKEALKHGSAPLHVAGMVLQSITNHRVTVHRARTNEATWNLIKGKPCSMTVDLKGEEMYHFLGKLVNLVLPRIKDWNGVRATTGDGSGNLAMGFNSEVVASFPEIETSFDNYPNIRQIPGLYITIHTTASCDKDARLLLQQLGIPFYGKIVD